MLEQLVCLILCVKVQVTYVETNKQIEPTGEISEGNAREDMGTGGLATADSQRGYVSSYSATFGGCLGCQKYYDSSGQLYYITASGERLDDSKYTLASNSIPLGKHVSVCNLDNGKCTGAKVNDTGGFDIPMYNNRIGDLSIATANAIDARTDQDIIEITVLE